MHSALIPVTLDILAMNGLYPTPCGELCNVVFIHRGAAVQHEVGPWNWPKYVSKGELVGDYKAIYSTSYRASWSKNLLTSWYLHSKICKIYPPYLDEAAIATYTPCTAYDKGVRILTFRVHWDARYSDTEWSS